ncbi:YbaB/EbfC family nucleoid-associated protein [Actinoplanes sp. DH11]|uniref:YbaB/EbfC family nucleoid-associated protein n=1 Tax=Actinoplanes sp. DH11 TaxID=2857011 RepID=UPI001E582948|nr:YbaB/EbfC family nucleoid-associated protein [Actinoplanes sp. DH11]
MDGNYVVTGESAGGWIRVELGGDGRLWDLVLDPRVTSLHTEQLRDGLVAAFRDAQDGLSSTGEEFARQASEDFAQEVADASATAERRFAELSTALYDITRKAGRPW